MSFPLPKPLGACALGLALSLTLGAAEPSATLTLQADHPGAVIHKEIYGQFAEHLGHCIYGGIWVGPDSPIPNTQGYRNDVLAALKDLKVPQLRWPGGCFADEYHWKDGIGPREKRPSMYNSHWGGVVENNAFGTHEFLNLCELLGIEPYVCLNVGSGTVQEAMEWVEYMTSPASSPMANMRRADGRDAPWKVPFVAVGNESWGCGGNMTASFYADNFKRYNTFVKNYSPGPENRIKRIACGPNGDNYEWTETMMKEAGRQMDGLALHFYTVPTGNWRAKGSATNFDEAEYFATLHRTLKMEELIAKHSAIMDKYDPQKRVGLVVDEWGVWTDVEPGTNPGFLFQQNSLRDAILAAINLHIFQAHADRVTMANIAQMVNVLQAMILTDGDKMVLTPTYHVFEMLNVHQGATSLPLTVTSPDYVNGDQKIPAVSASASRDAAGVVHVSLANADPHHAVSVSCALEGLAAKSVSGRILTAPAITSHNTFDAPHTVEPVAFNGAKLADGKLAIDLPAKSVVVLTLQ
ncbi:MAG TPA: alpha-N-arabinofuranosidase [Lacunisphaera sp.]|jgi:alpha-N-arabinofuranosidase|nr:alpha-N-arabinofuranosidase [Lacunisphaera sp.]